jgi:predicted nucleotidyltransferase
MSFGKPGDGKRSPENLRMPIPALTADGLLPEGIHDCTLDEIRKRFGSFQRTDRRCRLFERLESFVRAAKACGIVAAVLVDGSFVTDKDVPSDVDVIVVLRTDHDYDAVLRPMEYNVVATGQIRRVFRIDALIARDGSKELDDFVEWFAQVRNRPGVCKGMLRLMT